MIAENVPPRIAGLATSLPPGDIASTGAWRGKPAFDASIQIQKACVTLSDGRVVLRTRDAARRRRERREIARMPVPGSKAAKDRGTTRRRVRAVERV